MHPSDAPLLFQGDMEVTSEILGLRLSFEWKAFLGDNVVELVRKWTNTTASGRPSFILLSILQRSRQIGICRHFKYLFQIRHSTLAYIPRRTPRPSALREEIDGTCPSPCPAVKCHSSHMAQSISNNRILRRK